MPTDVVIALTVFITGERRVECILDCFSKLGCASVTVEANVSSINALDGHVDRQLTIHGSSMLLKGKTFLEVHREPLRRSQ